MLESLFGLATDITKLTLAAAGPSSVTGVHFKTTALPWGWSGGPEVSQPWLDLRGPFGSQLFVTAETAEVMRQSRLAQESLLGIHFRSITLSGREGFGGSAGLGGLFVKWCALESVRPRTYICYLFRTHLGRPEAEAQFEEIRRCVKMVELLS